MKGAIPLQTMFPFTHVSILPCLPHFVPAVQPFRSLTKKQFPTLLQFSLNKKHMENPQTDCSMPRFPSIYIASLTLVKPTTSLPISPEPCCSHAAARALYDTTVALLPLRSKLVEQSQGLGSVQRWGTKVATLW